MLPGDETPHEDTSVGLALRRGLEFRRGIGNDANPGRIDSPAPNEPGQMARGDDHPARSSRDDASQPANRACPRPDPRVLEIVDADRRPGAVHGPLPGPVADDLLDDGSTGEERRLEVE